MHVRICANQETLGAQQGWAGLGFKVPGVLGI